MEKSFSIIIPAHNEEEILEKSLREILKELENYRNFEIIVIENGSRDQTYQIAKKLSKEDQRIKLLHLEKASLGGATKEGIRKSQAEYIFIFNTDFWNIDFLKKSLELFPEYDIIVGSKCLPSSQDKRSFFRRFITAVLNLILKTFFHYPGTDTHGMKGLKQSKALPIINLCKTKYELFDTEFMVRSYQNGYNITELPVSIQEIRPTRYTLQNRVRNIFIDIILLCLPKKFSKN